MTSAANTSPGQSVILTSRSFTRSYSQPSSSLLPTTNSRQLLSFRSDPFISGSYNQPDIKSHGSRRPSFSSTFSRTTRTDSTGSLSEEASLVSFPSLPLPPSSLDKIISRLPKFQLTPFHRQVLKCALAYVLASLFTFVPFLARLLSWDHGGIGWPSVAGHMCATVVIYFHPAQPIGALLEADFYCLCCLIYAVFLCVLPLFLPISAIMPLSSNTTTPVNTLFVFSAAESLPSTPLSNELVSSSSFPPDSYSSVGPYEALLIASIGIGALSWAKAKVARPSFNVAATMSSIIVFSVVVMCGPFTLLFQATLASILGAITSNLVSVLLWPTRGSQILSTTLEQCILAFTSTLDDNSLTWEQRKEAVEKARRSLPALHLSLREAKIEHEVFAFVTFSSRRRRAARVRTRKEMEIVRSVGRFGTLIGGLVGLQAPVVSEVASEEIRGIISAIQGGLTEISAVITSNWMLEPLGSYQMKAAMVASRIALQGAEAQLKDAIDLSGEDQGLGTPSPFRKGYQGRYTRRVSDTEIRQKREDAYLYVRTLRDICMEVTSMIETLSQGSSDSRNFSGTSLMEYLRFVRGYGGTTSGTECKITVKDSSFPSLLGSFGTLKERVVSDSSSGCPPRSGEVQKKHCLASTPVPRLFFPKAALSILILALPAFIPTTHALYTEYRGEWALVSFFVVLTPHAGATGSMAIDRVLGTVIGAALGLISWVLFMDLLGGAGGQGNGGAEGVGGLRGIWGTVGLAAAAWLAAFACFWWIVKGGRRVFTARIVLLTYNLTCLYCYNLRHHAISVVSVAWHRAVAVSIGVLWAILVARFWWPLEAKSELGRGIAEFCEDLAWMYTRCATAHTALKQSEERFVPSERTALLPTHRQKHADGCTVDKCSSNVDSFIQETAALELILQTRLSYLRTLLVHTAHEPDLSTRKRFRDELYRETITRLEVLLQGVVWATWVISTTYGESKCDRELYWPKDAGAILPQQISFHIGEVQRMQRELTGQVVLTFSVLAATLRLSTRVSVYLPPIEQTRDSMLDTIRSSHSELVKEGLYFPLLVGAKASGPVATELESLTKWLRDICGIYPVGWAMPCDAVPAGV